MFSDFDGTLSPIVAIPAHAEPAQGAVAVLSALAERCLLVAVVTGRPGHFLDATIPKTVRLAASYGLERRIDNRWIDLADSGVWRPVVQAAAHDATRVLSPQVIVEAKGLSLTVHYRGAPGEAENVTNWAREAAHRFGLEARVAKQSIELHPQVPKDKGTVVQEWSVGALAAVYIGDDHGDLPAFQALNRLRRAGVETLAVAVGGAETPPELTEAADLVLGGPAQVVEFLEALLRRPA